jgi:aminoglycoside phosphotransferase (APT) family kinase protein
MSVSTARRPVNVGRVKLWMRSALGVSSIDVVKVMRRSSSVIVFADAITIPGRRHSVVCRVVTDADWIRRDSHVVEREYRICRYLRRNGWAVPEPLGIDALGEFAGAPAVIMSKIPGYCLGVPYTREAVSASAETLARLHSCEIPEKHAPWLGRYHQHEISATKPRPRWFRSNPAWDAAVHLFHSEPCNSGFILHRDFRMENLLFSPGNHLPSMVDWTDSSIGCPMVDISHFQVNLTLEGQGRHSEAFHRQYVQARPAPGDCDEECLMRAHIYAVLGMLSSVAEVADDIGRELETLIETAVQSLVTGNWRKSG